MSNSQEPNNKVSKQSPRVQFSSQLLAQLGVPIWQQNAEFFNRPVEKVDGKSSLKAEGLKELNASASPESEAMVNSSQQADSFSSSELLNSAAYGQVENSKVFLANGIDEVFQNDQMLSWRLWENIQQAFGWEESQVHFFDASTMVSEESLMACMEEVMALSVDQVFVMLDEHPAIEMLQEGVEVVRLPSLEAMLDDPYAKQEFYQTMMHYQ